jgi:hypothetical protein
VSTLPTALEAIIERHGRGAVADPLALAAALRGLTAPPSEPEIAALVEAVSTDALDRMRAALERGADAEAAVDAAVADRPDPAPARWAVTVLGVALGLLPRSLAAEGSPAVAAVAAAAAPTDPPRPRRRRPLVAGVAVVVLLLAGTAAVVRASYDDSTGPSAAAAGSVPDPVGTGGATPTTAAAVPRPPVDPRSVITDPDLFAFAEPYLTPSTVCIEHEQQVNVQQSVSCLLDEGHIGLFTTMFTTESMLGIRSVHLGGALATPASTRSLRWEFVPGRPGVRTGIPAGRAEQGEGVRIRFLDQRGQPQLYFDQESVACHALLGLADLSADPVADLDALRSYWADPTR